MRSQAFTFAAILVLAVARFALAADDLTTREEAAVLAAVSRAAPCVVTIETVGGAERVGQMLVGNGPGTGLIISSDGYILASAFNFVQKPQGILVTLADGRRLGAKLVATDRSRMVVLLKVESDEPLPTPEVAPVEELRVGQWAIALGRTFERSQPNMSVGIVSGLNRIWGKAIQTDARISPANYGGPLIDIHGRVIGVLVPLSPEKSTELAGVEWYDSGIGFAVPLAQLERAIPKLKQGTDLSPGVLGIALTDGDLYADPPVLKSVRPNSPAAKSGLAAGDKIVAVDGVDITRRVELTGTIHRHYAGDTLHLTIERNGDRLERDVTLAETIEPYRRPFLGILPELADNGVGVRWVYPDSPAAKAGLQIGDVIEAVDGNVVADSSALASWVGGQAIDQEVTLKVLRDGKPLELKVTLTTEPTAVPAELAARKEITVAKPAKKRKGPRTGEFTLEVGEFTNKCTVYVPSSYNAKQSFGLLMWLHGSETFDADALVERLKPACDRDHFVLVVPQAASEEGWTSREVAFVSQALEMTLGDYTIDPLRVAVFGHQDGGAMAYLTTWKERPLVRGVAALQAVVPGQPPENEPEHRLAFWLAGKKVGDDPKVQLLGELEYPVTLNNRDATGTLSDDELADMLRWFDSLDKI